MARGHIAEKGGRFYAVIDLGRDELSGRRRRRWSRGFTTWDEAEVERTRMLADRDRGERIDAARMTLGVFLAERWLPIIGDGLAPTTAAVYRVIVSAHIVPYIGHVRLDRLDASMLDALYVKLRREGGRQQQGLSAKSVRNVHGVLSSALKFAERKGLIPRSPAERAETPSGGRPETPEPWTAAELRTFLEHVEGDRLEALWWLVPFTGVRRSEALGLAWSDVELDRGGIAVTHTVTEGPGGPQRRRATKSRASRRRVSLGEGTVARLREHRLRQLEERLAWGEGYQDAGLVFCREDGSLLRPAWVSRRFEQLRAEAELRRIRFHDLRHAWASLAIEQGVPAKVIQERLGHASIAITMDVYGHLLEGLDRDAAATVEGAVLGSTSTQTSTQRASTGRDETPRRKRKALRDKG